MSNKPTIGSGRNADVFAQRGARRPLENQADYPRVTQSPQQYGYGVTPQNCIKPADGTWRTGCRPTSMNVVRPSGRQDPAPSMGPCIASPIRTRRQP